jgi:hypothetical protein
MFIASRLTFLGVKWLLLEHLRRAGDVKAAIFCCFRPNKLADGFVGLSVIFLACLRTVLRNPVSCQQLTEELKSMKERYDCTTFARLHPEQVIVPNL